MSQQTIAVIRSTYSPYGGAETLALDLLRALLDGPVRVHLLTARGQRWPIGHPALTVVPMPVWGANRLTEVWSFDRAVQRYLRRRRFDAVFSIDRVSRFTHLHAGGGSHKSFLESKNRSSTVIERLYRKTSLFHRTVLKIEKRGYSNPLLKRIHCCSKLVAENLRSDYGVPEERLQVIHNPVRWTEIGKSFDARRDIAEQLRREEGLDAGLRWLLFLGSGFRRKGLDLAIRGLSALPRDYGLLVVGAGRGKAIRALAADLGVESRVRLLGARPQGWRYASLCRAMVLPSRYEPFGLAAAEAQAMGLPVLVSRAAGYCERVRDGESGIVMEATSPRAAEDAFLRLDRLIERPVLAPGEIRSRVRGLDIRFFTQQMMEDFLGIAGAGAGSVASGGAVPAGEKAGC